MGRSRNRNHKKENKIGLYAQKTNTIIPIKNCLLVTEKLNDEIKKVLPSKEENIILRIGNKTGEILNQNSKKETIISYIGNKKYQVSKQSFFQVNNIITEKLYDEIKIIKKLKV